MYKGSIYKKRYICKRMKKKKKKKKKKKTQRIK